LKKAASIISLLSVLMAFLMGTTHSHAFKIDVTDRDYTVNILV
jgi:hypothetical protein